METPQLKLVVTIAYIGTAFAGSQIQKNGITVQELLDNVLCRLFNQKTVTTVFSGRTDRGVHARGQVVHACVNKHLPPTTVCRGLNALLPETIRVEHAMYAHEKFHARYDAKKRTYQYTIYYGQNMPLYLRDCAWHILPNAKIDIRKMQTCAKNLIGIKDFQVFCAANSSAKTTIRRVFASHIRTQNCPVWPGNKRTAGILITYTITANGFLYHMVRNIVATLVAVGMHSMTLAEVKALLHGVARSKLKAATAPAHGLILDTIEY